MHTINDNINQNETESDEFDKYYFASRDRASGFSIFFLTILIIAILAIFHPMSNTVTTSYSTYVLDATIVAMSYDDNNGYFMLVEGHHDNVLERHQISLTKEQFTEYKEGQWVSIQISSNNRYQLITSND